MKKYKPTTQEELEDILYDDSVYLGDIDTSLITDMSYLFLGSLRDDFSGIEKWDTSNVVNMNSMFADCMFFNQKLEWNTSKVTDMRFMFNNCINFNKPLEFDTSNVTDMDGMFDGCKKLEPKNLKSFNKDMMIKNFYNLNGFAQFIIKNNWIDMENNKFKPKNNAELKALVYTDDIKLDRIDTSLITDMSNLFNATFDSKRTDFSGINTWDTSKVVYMGAMFFNCERFNEKLSFDTSNVTDMSSMFCGCFSFNQVLDFDTKNVKSMYKMFKDCKSFNQSLDFDTSSVNDMDGMFDDCVSLKTLPKFYTDFIKKG